MFSVLVVEDDAQLNRLYCAYLEREGYQTHASHNANEALAAFGATTVDVMICDVMMPGVDGVALVDMVRASNPELPILMVTALSDLRSKQRAFNAGGDDYMVKPVDLGELSLRVAALLRRARAASERRLVIGSAQLDYDSFTLTEGERMQTLPPKEFQLLFKLCSNLGHIYTRRDIMDDVWGLDATSDDRTVDVHIRRLRERLEGSASIAIETVRGIGYRAVAL